MENFITILVFLLIGLAIRRLPVFHEETGNVLNLIVIYISLPALILMEVPKLTFTLDLFVPAFLPWVMLLFSCLLILFLSKILKWDRAATGCLLLLIPLGNTSFLGIPMVKVYFGEQAVKYAVLYDQLGSFLALAVYGSIILAFYGGPKSRPTVQSILKKVISFPPFIALMTALVLRLFHYPPAAAAALNILAATLVPLVMIAVGFQLKLRLNKSVTGQLAIGLGVKLIAAPLFALLICRLAGLDGEAVKVSIFEAGMPPMVSAGALAILAKLSPALTAALVGIGIVLSFVTLAGLYQLLI
jgi:predicted permease